MKLYDPVSSQKTYKGKDGIHYLRLFAPITCRTTKNCYKTLQFLGKGGNGSVYLTLCVSPDSENRGEYFALKFFQKPRSDERLSRFQEEIEILKTINHPNIIKYYDDGSYDVTKKIKLPFFISGYMPQTFDKAMINCRRIYSFMYATQLLSALKKLNREGIIHRDIKPQNIFVNGLSVVLGDFGLMKKINNSLSEELLNEDIDMLSHSRCIGQPFYYRSPDIISYAIKNSDLTTKSDIFQLGLIFAEMFTGKNPLKPANNLSDPIEFNDPLLGFIKGNNVNFIYALIRAMLELNPNNRPNVDDLLNKFIRLLENYSESKFMLDGQLF
jgi:serine/threonine protein kinase